MTNLKTTTRKATEGFVLRGAPDNFGCADEKSRFDIEKPKGMRYNVTVVDSLSHKSNGVYKE